MQRKSRTHAPHTRRHLAVGAALICLSTFIPQLSTIFAQGTAFTFQGQLTDNNAPANGQYDLEFRLFDAASGGAQQGSTLTFEDQEINSGVFNVSLDFGSDVFDGNARWLEIGVRSGASTAAFSVLVPRQQITSTPYAIRAASFEGPVKAAQLTGKIPPSNIGNESITSDMLAPGAVTTAALADGAVTSTKIAAGAGAIPSQIIAGTSVQAQSNTSYDATDAAQVTVTLPANAGIGDVVRVNGLGAGGWQVVPAPGQSINGFEAGGLLTPRESSRHWSSVASSADGAKLVAVVYGGQIYTSTDGGMTWIARETTRNWDSVASSADGAKLVAVAYGGQIYNSTDGGTTWTARETIRGWQSIASSADGNRLVAVENGGQIYTSGDGGTTWTARETIRSWQSVASSADGNRLVAVENGGQIYTSSDGGITWTARENNRNWESVASSADGEKLVAVAWNSQIYISTDNGATWTPRENTRLWNAIASSADGSKLVAVAYNGQIFISIDNGATWTPRDTSRDWTSVVLSADGGNLVATENRGQIYTSTMPSFIGTQGSTVELQYMGNGAWQPLSGASSPQIVAGGSVRAQPNTAYDATGGGQVTVNLPPNARIGDRIEINGLGAGGWQVVGADQLINGFQAGVQWTARESSRRWWSVASSADGSKLAAVSYGLNSGQIFTSTDGGATWTARETIRKWSSVASSADGSKLVAAVEGGQIYTSTDSGVTWTARDSDRAWWSVVSSPDGSKLVAIENDTAEDGDGQLYTSSDSGATWVPRENTRNWWSVALSADGSKLVAVVYGGQIYISTDSGTTWTPRETSRNWWSVASSADGTRLVAVVDGGQIYTSTDSGTTWIPRETSRNWWSVASSADGSRLVAVVFGGQVYTSADGGATWTARDANRSWRSVASSAYGDRLVACVDGGQIFTSASFPLTGAQGSKVELQYAGNGLWQPLSTDASLSLGLGSVTAGMLAAGSVDTSALADGAVTASKIAAGQAVKSLDGLKDDVTLSAGPNVTLTTNGNNLQISAAGPANAWSLTGNAGTAPGANFLGTTDNQALELKVKNTRALRIEPTAAAPAFIGGYSENSASGPGAVVAGGGTRGSINEASGDYAFVGAGHGSKAGSFSAVVGGAYNVSLSLFSFLGSGLSNTNQADFSVIAGGTNNLLQAGSDGSDVGGGLFNQIQSNSIASTVSGGWRNTIGTNCEASAIGGGENNRIQALFSTGFFGASSYNSTIGGGAFNTIQAWLATIGGGDGNTNQSVLSTIGGGDQNAIQPDATASTIGGGGHNTIQTNALASTIGGGVSNIVRSNSPYSTIGGGLGNTIDSSAPYSTIPGGAGNVAAGAYSLAAGQHAQAFHQGAFVWADSQNAPFASTALDQFSIRAQGGVRLNTDTTLFFGNTSKSALSPDQGGSIELGDPTAPIFTAPYIDFHHGINPAAADYNVRIINDGEQILKIMRYGSTTPMATFTEGGLTVNGSVCCSSDRGQKENFQRLDPAAVLAKVAALPLSQWNYKEDTRSQHLGPMAQDFYAAFGLGPDDKHIATVDAEGVALAAIQGLNQRLQEKDAVIEELRARLERLEECLQFQLGSAQALGKSAPAHDPLSHPSLEQEN